MVYIDFITMLIIEVLSFSIIPISTFRGAIVSEIQKCLPKAILLQDLHCLQRFYHSVGHWGTIIQNFTFSRAFISQI